MVDRIKNDALSLQSFCLLHLSRDKMFIDCVIPGRATRTYRQMSKASYIMYDIHPSIKWTFAFTLSYIFYILMVIRNIGLVWVGFFFCFDSLFIFKCSFWLLSVSLKYANSIRHTSICMTKTMKENDEYKTKNKNHPKIRWEMIFYHQRNKNKRRDKKILSWIRMKTALIHNEPLLLPSESKWNRYSQIIYTYIYTLKVSYMHNFLFWYDNGDGNGDGNIGMCERENKIPNEILTWFHHALWSWAGIETVWHIYTSTPSPSPSIRRTLVNIPMNNFA